MIPAPLNIFLIPLQLTQYLFEQHRKVIDRMNRKISFYLIVFIIFVPFFIIVGLLLTIPSFFITFLRINRAYDGFFAKIVRWILWIPFGFPYLIYIIFFNDIPLFLSSLNLRPIIFKDLKEIENRKYLFVIKMLVTIRNQKIAAFKDRLNDAENEEK